MTRLAHIDANGFLLDSFLLGRRVFETGFRPKHAVSIWRGGTPVGLGVDAYFKCHGASFNHTCIATESYVGIGTQEEVVVKGLEHVIKVICPEDGLLILDDVYESGNTIKKIVETLRSEARANAPEEIMVATIHTKPEKYRYHELPHIYLKSLPGEVWIDYPHELADLYDPNDPTDRLIKAKDSAIWEIVRAERPFPVEEVDHKGGRLYVTAYELLLDSLKLGVNISLDDSFVPDFLIALWPGGVSAGLPVHEVYKYIQARRARGRPRLDHVAINTTPSYQSYKVNVIGMRYLEERISHHHNILIIDTTFRSGRMLNDVIMKLKGALRRNLSQNRVRVASVYHDPDDRSTWTVQPVVREPDYFVKKVNADVIFPQNVARLTNPMRDLRELNPQLADIIWGQAPSEPSPYTESET